MDLKIQSIKQESSIFESKIATTTPAPTGRTHCSLMIALGFLFVTILYPLALPVSASSAIYACPNSSISITAEEPVDHNAICNSAEDALAFFNRFGIKLPCHIVIVIAQNLPDWMNETAVGCYQQEAQKVFVLTYPEYEKRQVWFGVPINRLMYRSLVTHEIAHAVAGCNFSISAPTHHAKEYVAYVAMFTMMNPTLRAHILENFSAAGLDNGFQFNEITYAFDPMRFGVEAYRHYLKQGHGDTFILKVLSGKALTNSLHNLR